MGIRLRVSPPQFAAVLLVCCRCSRCYFRCVAEDQTLRAAFLVAMPQLEDPNFHRTVALIVEHDENGTFGLVLNRSAEVLTSTLCASLDVVWRGDPEANIGWGGPVEPNTGWLLLDDTGRLDIEETAVSRVGDHELYLARSIEVLRSAAAESPAHMRFYLGYAGWGPGQLEWEMAQGAWIVAPFDGNALFHSDEGSMWEEAVRSLGIDPTTLVSTQGVH